MANFFSEFSYEYLNLSSTFNRNTVWRRSICKTVWYTFRYPIKDFFFSFVVLCIQRNRSELIASIDRDTKSNVQLTFN